MESKKKAQRKLEKYFEMTENEITTYQNIDRQLKQWWDKSVAVNTYIIKEQISQINNLTIHPP